MMNEILRLVVVVTACYLLGSIPFGVVFGRVLKGVDVRRHGSTHTGGLNTLRVAGAPAGVLAALCDGGKGVAAILLAQACGPEFWSVPLASLAAVVGHNWSLYIGFTGGLGLATLAGCVILFRPEAIPLAAVIYGVLYLILGNRPRAAAGAVLSLGPLLWALGASESLIVLGILAGGASFVKHILEMRRGYGSRALTTGGAPGDGAT